MRMRECSVATLLSARGAQLEGAGIDLQQLKSRSKLTRLIGENYQAFEIARGIILQRPSPERPGPQVLHVLNVIEAAGLARHADSGWLVGPASMRYLRGGWLEEYAALAALHAEADEVRAGQIVRWVSGPYDGVNEVDLIARFGERLVFASCKALWSRFEVGAEAQRERLTSALHEADNTLDHFGGGNDRAALVVSTDLYDERRDIPRYRQLHGKAHALDVALIPLEDFAFAALAARFRRLGRDENGAS